VKNSGQFQEVHIPVVLTIEKKPGPPIVKTQAIDVIDPGQTKTVVFRSIGQPDFGAPRTLKVEVKPVPGETNTTNNSATYSVTFSVA
jgi:hypothetical protein